MSRQHISVSLRRLVRERAKECCEYCRSQERFAMHSFSVEHITPLARGGETIENNLALACQGCNNRKYTKIEGLDPLTGEKAPLFHPRRQRWGEHFAWNDDCTLILGLTPTGRATVEELQLNRESLINLRSILYSAGEHPPPTE